MSISRGARLYGQLIVISSLATANGPLPPLWNLGLAGFFEVEVPAQIWNFKST
jgi:hypothetical protein